MEYLKKHLNLFLVLLIVSFIYSSIYTTAQQVLRMDANDPQIQLAEDAVARLNNNARPQDIAKGTSVNMATSLVPFLIIYDKSGYGVANSGYLSGHFPEIPLYVLKSSDNKPNGNRVTWQPADGVRIASVTVAAKNYYVLAGRNLREVENREAGILKIPTFSWLVTVLLIVFFYKYRVTKKESEKKLSGKLGKK